MTHSIKHQTAVSVKGITKAFGNFRAVDDLSFDVYEGEVFAILGPNGAGKSTTIRMILDILKPDSGSISVFGAPLNERAKDRIGYLPEERGLYKNAKVIEMMTYLGALKGMTNAQARAKALALLERIGLGEHAKSKVSELSKGMQQKVQFAVTIIHEPDLMIIDEPFSGLDPVNTLVIKELLLEMAARGKTVMMSTHQMYQVEEMAQRLLMVNQGKQALYGTVGEVRQLYARHAVIVEGTGDWARLHSVASVELHTNGRPGALLHLKPNLSANDLLGELATATEMHIDRFERAVPSLNDIFIQVAGVPGDFDLSGRVLTES
ncbi:MAG: ATP-binding cassette domain-containing protein [Armatimonadetes bacterium]|nr:ATP-binding cassette domain-containing protein [Anaerolineae bacterium]